MRFANSRWIIDALVKNMMQNLELDLDFIAAFAVLYLLLLSSILSIIYGSLKQLHTATIS
jgi:hypothetical protein